MLFKHDMTMYVIRLLLIVLGALLLAGTARAQNAWINEIHYDNDGGDEGEFVEIVVENAGDYDLAQLEIVLYNGSGGDTEGSEMISNLTGTTSGNFTTYSWATSGIQNGAPDGMVLCYHGSVVSSGGVAQFLSYEGTFTASEGCADGLTSTDVGVAEPGAVGESLQLVGTGSDYAAFSWTGPVAESPGSVNTGQTLGGGGSATTTVQFAAASASVVEGDAGPTTYGVTVTITNLDDDEHTTADVVATGGTATSGIDYSYSATQVTFPAGSSDDQTVSVTIIGDADLEGDETITFELRNVSGGNSAGAGAPDMLELTITGDDMLLPTLVINEFLADPDADDGDANGDEVVGTTEDEFVEIYNSGATTVDLSGYRLSDAVGVRHVFAEGTTLSAGAFIVVFGGGDPANFTGIPAPAVAASEGSLGLNNGGDEISILPATGDDALVTVTYGSEGGNNVAIARSPDFTGSFVAHETIESNPVLFSPGEANVGDPEETLTIDGTAGTGNDAGWRMLASPVAGATRADLGDDVTFSTGTGEMFYTWDGADWAVGAGSTPLTNGTGFILYLFDDATDPIDPDLRLDVPGTPPPSDVTVLGLDQNDVWHLLGNPYGQSFDLSGLDLASNGFQAVAQVWDPVDDTYETITEGTGDLVAAWQGFFVQRTEAGSGATSLMFDAASRTTGAVFYGKQGQQATAASYRKLGLRLRAFDESGDEAARDEAASLYFSPQAASGWDAYDAAKASMPPGAARAELALLGEYGGSVVEKAQESRALDPEAFEVELSVRVEGAAGERVLEWPVWEHVPEAWMLELTDRATSTAVDLRAEAGYTFEAVDHEGPRFVLRIGATATAMEEEALPERLALSPPHPNPARTAVRLAYALPASSEVRVVVYDVLGREVAVVTEEPRAAGVQELTWQVPARLSAGLYVVRLEAGAQVRTRRLVVVR